MLAVNPHSKGHLTGTVALWDLLAIRVCTLSVRACLSLEQSLQPMFDYRGRLSPDCHIYVLNISSTIDKLSRSNWLPSSLAKQQLPNYVRRQDYLSSFELGFWIKHQKQYLNNMWSWIKDSLHFSLTKKKNKKTTDYGGPFCSISKDFPGCFNS